MSKKWASNEKDQLLVENFKKFMEEGDFSPTLDELANVSNPDEGSTEYDKNIVLKYLPKEKQSIRAPQNSPDLVKMAIANVKRRIEMLKKQPDHHRSSDRNQMYAGSGQQIEQELHDLQKDGEYLIALYKKSQPEDKLEEYENWSLEDLKGSQGTGVDTPNEDMDCEELKRLYKTQPNSRAELKPIMKKKGCFQKQEEQMSHEMGAYNRQDEEYKDCMEKDGKWVGGRDLDAHCVPKDKEK